MFNNAGIMHPDDDNALTTTEKVWDLTFDINVKVRWQRPTLRQGAASAFL